MFRQVTLGLIIATVAVAPALAQAGDTSSRIVHLTISWTDSTRPEPWTPSATDHRGLMVVLSYRAGDVEPAPLVLFSTGRNVAPGSYGDLADALARSGYVVAIVDHLGERSGQRLPNGASVANLLPSVAPDRESPTFRVEDSIFSRRWVELRAADLSSARIHLQRLAAIAGNALSGRLNDRAAAAGHSLGGLTAAKACEQDAAFVACANLDGLSYSLPMHVDGSAMVANQPFLFLGKPIPRLSDATLERERMTRAEDDAIVARMARRFDELMLSAKGGSYRVILRGAEHMEFTGSGNGTIARLVRGYLLAFLDQQLRSLRGTLLDAPTTDSAAVVTRYTPRP